MYCMVCEWLRGKKGGGGGAGGKGMNGWEGKEEGERCKVADGGELEKSERKTRGIEGERFG